MIPYVLMKKFPSLSFAQALSDTRDALEKEGFGVLTEIDVQTVFKNKLDVDFPPYRILGACNPTFAHEALEADDKIGALLPCNVVVQGRDDGTEIAIADPLATLAIVGDSRLDEIAEQVRTRLERVLEHLS